MQILISIVKRDLPDPTSDHEDFLTLKVFAAELLYYVLEKLHNPVLRNEVVAILLKSLLQGSASAYVDYGCLVALKTFGPQVS